MSPEKFFERTVLDLHDRSRTKAAPVPLHRFRAAVRPLAAIVCRGLDEAVGHQQLRVLPACVNSMGTSAHRDRPTQALSIRSDTSVVESCPKTKVRRRRIPLQMPRSTTQLAAASTGFLGAAPKSAACTRCGQARPRASATSARRLLSEPKICGLLISLAGSTWKQELHLLGP